MPEAPVPQQTLKQRGEIPRQIRQLWITRFDFLLGCLPGKEAPSDIDLVLEKNSHFLFLECKRPHQPTVKGQEILLDRLVHLSRPESTVRVLIVVGHPPDQIQKYGWWRKPLRDGTAWDVRDLVLRWRNWAAAQ